MVLQAIFMPDKFFYRESGTAGLWGDFWSNYQIQNLKNKTILSLFEQKSRPGLCVRPKKQTKNKKS